MRSSLRRRSRSPPRSIHGGIGWTSESKSGASDPALVEEQVAGDEMENDPLDEILAGRDELIASLECRLAQRVERETLVSICWKLA